MDGRLYDDKLGDAEHATGIWTKVLEFEPTDREAFEALERGHGKLERHDALHDLFRRPVAATSTPCTAPHDTRVARRTQVAA